MATQAVEMLRRIRDEQARQLAGKSDAELIAFFRVCRPGVPQRGDPAGLSEAAWRRRQASWAHAAEMTMG
ncbi:MAG: hypothetical protein ACUVUC_02310 [Thermoguttaceae bacterium]